MLNVNNRLNVIHIEFLLSEIYLKLLHDFSSFSCFLFHIFYVIKSVTNSIPPRKKEGRCKKTRIN